MVPTVKSVVGLHDKVTLTFSEDLEEDSVPGKSAFTVGTLGYVFPTTGVALSGSTVTLTLGRPLTSEEPSLLVFYNSAAASNKLKDPIGNEMSSFSPDLDNQTRPATVTDRELDSDPGSDGTFAIGDELRVKVTMSEAVTVDTTNGTPRLKLRVNSTGSGASESNPYADYVSGSGTDELIFAWTVAEGYADTNGIWIANGELEKNGGTVKVQATDANLHNTGFYPSGIYVDGIRPTLTKTETSVRGTQVEATFSEDIRQATMTVTAGAREETVAADSIAGSLVRLTPTTVIEPGETVTVSAAADAVKDAAGNGNAAIGDQAVENKTAPPAVASVDITSDPGEDGAYGIGDKVEATVEFGYSVSVTGVPELGLDIGGETRRATYASGTGSAKLVFEYEVAADDEDGNGIAIGANGLSLAGGSIAAEVSATRRALLRHDAVAADTDHKVDGVRPAPTGAETSADGSKIEITFSENVGKSGSGAWLVSYGGGGYVNRDWSVADNVVTLSLDPSVEENQNVKTYGAPDIVEDDVGNGNAEIDDYPVTNNVVRPTISSITLTSDPSDGVYAIGETVEAMVTFTADVTVADAGGEPSLELDIGNAAREAGLSSGSGSDSLVFSYTVVAGDLDGNGIAIEADKLALNGGTIRDSLGLDARLGHEAVSSQPGHKVDGVVPEVLSAVVDTEDDAGALVLTFFEALDGESTPAAGAFAVTVGASDTANTVTAVAIDGAKVTLTLTTDVAASATNVKVDYTKPATNPLRDAAGNDAATFSGQAVEVTSIARVSSISFSTDAGTEAPLIIGDYLYAVVTFTKAVTVSGKPQIELDIGGNARVADYVQSSQDGTRPGFRYTIVEGDSDPDGVSIGASKLTLPSGASIQDGSDAAILTHAAVADDDGHTVDGVRPTLIGAETSIDGKKIVLTFSENIAAVPDTYIVVINGTPHLSQGVDTNIADSVVTLSSLGVTFREGQAVTITVAADTVKDTAGNYSQKITSTVDNTVVRPTVALTSEAGSDNAYAIGETVEATATFSREVTVTGAPTLKLQVGGNERTAAYDADGSSGAAVVFTYTVAAGETDSDGISIGRDKLALNGGTIQADGADAPLTHRPAAAQGGHRVDGVVPTFVGAAVNTSDDNKALVLTFTEALDENSTPAGTVFTVSGSNTVTNVAIDGSTVTLTLTTAASVGDTVTVDYTKPSGNPLQDLAGNDVVTFGAQSVMVTAIAGVSSITLTSDPGTDGAYAIGDTVQATVTFTGDVTVSGDPGLALDFGGGETETAAYDSGSGSAELVFTYTVAAGDLATGGIAFAANSLSLNGGSIRDGSDDAGLTHGVIAADSAHRVDGVRPAKAAAETSPDGTEILLDFDENVQVTGDSFAVSYGGQGYTLGSDSVKDDVVKLALDVPVRDGQTITMSFAEDVVADAAGNNNGYQASFGVVNNVDNPTLSVTSGAGIYGIGEEIQVTATFGEAMTVTGTPTLELDIGGMAKPAAYDAAESSGAAVVFTYAVVKDDEDGDGIAIGANGISLAGGTIRNADGQNPSLVHDAVPADSDHRVDGVVPTLSGAEIDTTADPKALVLSYSEALDEDSEPAGDNFAVSVATVTNTVTAVDVDGSKVTLTLTTAVAATDAGTVTLTYAQATATNPIQDKAGNDAVQLVGQSVTVRSGPPTVSIAADDEDISEGTAAAFTLSRTGPTAAALAVTLEVGQEGEFTAISNEGTRTETFSAGSATKAFSFATEDDTTGEDDGFIIVRITAVPSGNLISTTADEAYVAIEDLDTKVVFRLEKTALTVSESAGTAPITIVGRMEPGVSPVDEKLPVSLSTQDGVATSPEDFPVRTEEVDFNAEDFTLENGRYVARKTVDVAIVDSDGVYEGDETFGMLLERHAGLQGYALIDGPGEDTEDTLTVTIRENDPKPSLALSFPRTADEGDTVEVKVVSTNGSAFAEDQTVTLSFGGSATRGTGNDYLVKEDGTTATGDLTLTLDAGETSVVAAMIEVLGTPTTTRATRPSW